MFVMFNTLN